MKKKLPPPPSCPVPEAFRTLTWEDLDKWTDPRSIQRGRSYVGNVSDPGIAEDGRIVATVTGRDDYATEIRFDKSGELQGRCTCPVGRRCKHTVALVLKCIDLLGAGKELPLLEEGDERLEELLDSEDLEEERDDVEADGEESETATETASPPVQSSVSRSQSRDELSAYIDSLNETAAKALLREILAGHNDIGTDLLRRIRTDRGDVAQLLWMARKELKRLAREPAYVNPWKHEHCIPNYAPLENILRKLFEKKAFDDLVAFGDELREETASQIQCADDEGDTARQIGDCMEIVAEAVRHSSLSNGERLRWFCALHEDDDYCAFEELYDPFDNPADWKASDWSDFSDELRNSFESPHPGSKDGDDEEESEYARERRLGRICAALRNAGRANEARAIRIDWLKKSRKYCELAKFYRDEGDLDAAWKTAVDGLSRSDVHDPYGYAKSRLRDFLRNLATERGDARLALSIQAEDFFSEPSKGGFFDLLAAAEREHFAEAIRPWLVRFLETGRRPDDSDAVAAKPPRSRKRGRPPKAIAPAHAASSDPKPTVPWPLVPSGFPFAKRSLYADSGPEILLDVALQEKNPDEVLHRWERLRNKIGPSGFGRWDERSDLADTVADAIAESYPEESLRIWDGCVKRDLSSPCQYAYDAIAERFRKARPVMEKLGRIGEWENRIRSLRDEYKRRKNFVKALSALIDPPAPAPTILQTRNS